MARLLEVVTGGSFELGLIESFGGIKQTDAAVYIAKGVLAVATGGLGEMGWQHRQVGTRHGQGESMPCSVVRWSCLLKRGPAVWTGVSIQSLPCLSSCRR